MNVQTSTPLNPFEFQIPKDLTIAKARSIWDRYAMRTLLSKMLPLASAFFLLIGSGPAFGGINDGLLAHYPLDGNGRDASGHGHDGSVESATPAANRFGQAGKALLFNGTNSFISVPDSESLRLSGTDFTISAWIFETARDNHFNDCIVSKRETGPPRYEPGNTHGWILNIRGLLDPTSTGRLLFQVSGGEDPGALSSSILSLNQWHHVAVAYHRAEQSVDIFVDGIQESRPTGAVDVHTNALAWISSTNGVPPPNPAITSEMHIGNNSETGHDNAYVFHGRISDLRIYNRALSASELAELYGTGVFVDGTQFTGNALVRLYGGLRRGEKVIVESSSDLTHWIPTETNIVERSSLSVSNFVHRARPAEFFRVSVRD